jgi:carbonic anhydrase
VWSSHSVDFVKRLKELDPILSKFVKSGELKVVGATYERHTGSVKLFSSK